jgi:hypothetical protein
MTKVSTDRRPDGQHGTTTETDGRLGDTGRIDHPRADRLTSSDLRSVDR